MKVDPVMDARIIDMFNSGHTVKSINKAYPDYSEDVIQIILRVEFRRLRLLKAHLLDALKE